MNDLLTVLLAILGFAGWEVARRGWRVASRETANARDLAAKLNAEFGRRLNAEEDARSWETVASQRGDRLEVALDQLGAIRQAVTRRPPRRRWLALMHRAARIAGTA